MYSLILLGDPSGNFPKLFKPHPANTYSAVSFKTPFSTLLSLFPLIFDLLVLTDLLRSSLYEMIMNSLYLTP